jgi:hypothetical protein
MESGNLESGIWNQDGGPRTEESGLGLAKVELARHTFF